MIILPMREHKRCVCKEPISEKFHELHPVPRYPKGYLLKLTDDLNQTLSHICRGEGWLDLSLAIVTNFSARGNGVDSGGGLAKGHWPWTAMPGSDFIQPGKPRLMMPFYRIWFKSTLTTLIYSSLSNTSVRFYSRLIILKWQGSV